LTTGSKNKAVVRATIPIGKSFTFGERKEEGGTNRFMIISTISGRIAKKTFSFLTEPFATGQNQNLRFRLYVKCPKVVWKLEAVDGKNTSTIRRQK
jgi:hypothetical protein